MLANADVNAIRALMESLLRAIFDHLYPDTSNGNWPGKLVGSPMAVSSARW
jgi:hypothetical protein